MISKEGNCAYIDGANLHKGIGTLGWELDYARFRIWLRDKHKVGRAYLFLGYIPEFADLYNDLEKAGYLLVFKEVVRDLDGRIKGNCDADLVLAATCGAYEVHYEQAVIVSSDGDYACLVNFLLKRNKMKAILSPSNKCSVLLYRSGAPITFLGQLKEKLAKIKKPPIRTEP